MQILQQKIRWQRIDYRKERKSSQSRGRSIETRIPLNNGHLFEISTSFQRDWLTSVETNKRAGHVDTHGPLISLRCI